MGRLNEFSEIFSLSWFRNLFEREYWFLFWSVIGHLTTQLERGGIYGSSLEGIQSSMTGKAAAAMAVTVACGAAGCIMAADRR